MARSRVDPDYYARLGIPPSAREADIRRAYRRLALQWHPDRNPGRPAAAERFRDISEAYAVLSDPAKRRVYDQARHAGDANVFHQRREDVLRDLFTNARASSVFDDLAREFERHGLRVDRQHFRQTLFGDGAVVTGVVVITPVAPMSTLLRVAGAALRAAAGRPPARDAAPAHDARHPPVRPQGILGWVARAGRLLLGLPSHGGSSSADLVVPLRLTRTEAARGARKPVTLPRGGGEDAVLVTVPAGVRAGTRLRLRGKGAERPGRPPGDAYLRVEIVD